METQQLIHRLCGIVGTGHLQPGDEQAAPSIVPTEWERWPICVVQPVTTAEIVAIVQAAEDAGAAIVPCGGGSRLATGYPPNEEKPFIIVSTARMNRVLDYQPDDLTVTCEPGITLGALQQTLAERRQFLALDCPLPERTTLGGIVSTNTAGFSRPMYGTPRDLLIGVKAVMTSGIEVKGGGKVVKNVAGYDVCKLFTGSWGTLGIITELTFKIRPVNEAETVLSWATPDVETAARLALEVFHSRLAPAFVLATNEPEGRPALVVGLQGVASRVRWQQEELKRFVLGLGHEHAPIVMGESERKSLQDVQARLHRGVHLAARIACLPTDLPGTIGSLQLLPDVRMTAECSVGTINIASPNPDLALTLSIRTAAPSTAHIVWTHVEPAIARRQNLAVWGEPRQDSGLQKALKQSLDPKGTFSPGRFVGGL